MSCPRLLLALATLACAAGAQAVEIAKPDDALVQRFMQHPEELTARIDDCARMSMADAVGSAVCVSTKEARYQRERAVLRSAKGPALTTSVMSSTAAPQGTRAALPTAAATPAPALPSLSLIAQATDRP
jgi:hypothetical protein